MSEKQKEKADYIAPTIIVIGLVVLCILFLFSNDEQKLDLNVFSTLLVALLALLGITIQIKATRDIEAERRIHELNLNHRNAVAQIKMKSYESRKETYLQLLRPFMEAMLSQRRGEVPNPQAQIEQMIRANIDIQLFGSDETCRIFNEFRAMGFKTPVDDEIVQKQRMAAMLVFYARIILSIRRDMGQEDTSVDEYAILRSFINDIDSYRVEINNALKWETADQVP